MISFHATLEKFGNNVNVPPFNLELCLRNFLHGKALFSKCFPSKLRRKLAFSNSSSLKSVFVTD